MKRFTIGLVLSLLLVMGGQAFAQTRSYMCLGASLPMGNFGKGNADTWSLINANQDNRNGGASIGANVGLNWNFGIGVPGLSVMFSIDGFYNGLNSNLKDYYEAKEITMKNDPLVHKYDLSLPNYINVPVMAGLSQIFYLTPSFGIYLNAGIGGNARFLTWYHEAINYVDAETAAPRWVLEYKTAFSLAYQVGLGIEVAKGFTVNASFYDLGASAVVAERTQPEGGTDIYKNEKGVRPQMLLVRIGFRF